MDIWWHFGQRSFSNHAFQQIKGSQISTRTENEGETHSVSETGDPRRHPEIEPSIYEAQVTSQVLGGRSSQTMPIGTSLFADRDVPPDQSSPPVLAPGSSIDKVPQVSHMTETQKKHILKTHLNRTRASYNRSGADRKRISPNANNNYPTKATERERERHRLEWTGRS